MTTPDFRALCAELIDAMDSGITAERIRMSPLADRARAALDQPLSPAAQAVLDAFHKELSPDNQPGGLPAALRAAADQVVPVTPAPNDTFCCPPVQTTVWMALARVRSQLLAIAAELEAQP